MQLSRYARRRNCRRATAKQKKMNVWFLQQSSERTPLREQLLALLPQLGMRPGRGGSRSCRRRPHRAAAATAAHDIAAARTPRRGPRWGRARAADFAGDPGWRRSQARSARLSSSDRRPILSRPGTPSTKHWLSSRSPLPRLDDSCAPGLDADPVQKQRSSASIWARRSRSTASLAIVVSWNRAIFSPPPLTWRMRSTVSPASYS